MTSSNFLVYLYELGLSIASRSLFDFGFNAHFSGLDASGLFLARTNVIQRSKLKSWDLLELSCCPIAICAFPQGHILFKVKLNSIKTKDIKRKAITMEIRGKIIELLPENLDNLQMVDGKQEYILETDVNT